MAIAFDTSSKSGASWSTTTPTVSYSHTCTGSDRCLTVEVTSYHLLGAIVHNSVTYGGVSMTKITEVAILEGGAEARISLWRLANPSSGSNTLLASMNGGNNVDYAFVSASSFTGVDQTTPIDAFGAATPTLSTASTLPTASATVTVSGAWLVGCFFGSGGGITGGSGTTIRQQSESTGVADSNGTVSTGSQSLAYNASPNSKGYGVIVAALKPAGGTAYTIPADQGSYALTGQTAGLFFNRNIFADQGSYALTGQDVTLTKETPGAYNMPADAGSYVLTGSDALADYAMNIGQGAYALSGQDVSFSRTYPQNYSITADQGSYSLTGRSVRLDWSGAPIVPNRGTGLNMGMKIGL